MELTSRQSDILALLKRIKRVRVEDLAERFATTPQTIRKELQSLADAHLAVRFHGGAILPTGLEYSSISDRKQAATAEKLAIGEVVAQRIPNDCVIFVNAGTTTECVVRALSSHSQLRIIVDNVDLAAKAMRFAGVEVIVPGGVVRGSDGAILGSDAVDFIRQFNVDFAVVSAAAVDRNGALLDYDLEESQVCRAMIANARHVILAIDGGKFDRTAPVRVASMEAVHTLVTDDGAPSWVEDLCRSNDVELAIAPVSISAAPQSSTGLS